MPTASVVDTSLHCVCVMCAATRRVQSGFITTLFWPTILDGVLHFFDQGPARQLIANSWRAKMYLFLSIKCMCVEDLSMPS